MMEFNDLNHNKRESLYLQLYSQIKSKIENGQIKQGEKLPSIRNLAYDLQVSKTTIQTTYDQLVAEGYIQSFPKKGYFVVVQNTIIPKQRVEQKPIEEISTHSTPYNFLSSEVDRHSVDIKRWRSLIKEVLLQESQLISYGDPQGEAHLRQALADYSATVRGVQATKEQVVVGAGIAPLLHILCGILRTKLLHFTVGMEENSFPTGEQVFLDAGIPIVPLRADQEGVTLSSLVKSKPQAVLLNPSKASEKMPAMPLNRRIDLLQSANKKNLYIIEDDYNGELRFLAKPIPALKSIDKDDRVIYIGSFSKLLLPSVRISYMVLPQPLLQYYLAVRNNYNQTASKIEQLALIQYINDGSMQKHIRKLRKVYSKKAKVLMDALKNEFPLQTSIVLQETALRVVVSLKTKVNDIELERKTKEKGIFLHKASYNKEKKYLTFFLSFSGIEEENIPIGVRKLKEILLSD